MWRATKKNRVVRMRARATWAGLTLAVMLLLLPTMAPVCETEPNDTSGTANLIRQREIGDGDITPVGDADFWRTEGAAVGDLVFAYVDTQDSTTSKDSILTVLANDGTTVIESDDDDGPSVSSVVAGAIVPQTGDVFYEVIKFANSNTITPYRLYQAIIDPGATVSEVEGNGTSATANTISAPIVTGDVAGADVDFFKFHAPAGAPVVVIMDDDPDDNVSLTDTELDILDTDGSTVLAAGDDGSCNDGNAAGAVTAPSDGTYFVRVSNLHQGCDADVDYRFVVLVNGVVYVDTDGDGIPDSDDNCPLIANGAQLDTDGDGFGNSCDDCPTSILKQSPGVCGCDQPDVDINGDGVIDCGLADPARAMLAGPGILLVPDEDNDRVMAFDPADGDLIDPNFIPADPANLATPIAAILGPDNNSILVVDQTNDVVQSYDLDGNYLGVFAPAGGVDLTILDSPSGITRRPNGNVVVGVGAGANVDAVAEFDSAGNHVGNFIANGLGGLGLPTDLHFRANGNALVSGVGSGAVHEYDAAGAYISDFATVAGAPRQLIEAANGNVFATVFFGDQRGVLEYQSDGTFVMQHTPSSLDVFTGVFELGNGNLLITAGVQVTTDPGTPGGVFEIDLNGNIVDTEIAGTSMLFIEFALQDADGDGVGDDLDGCPSDATKVAPGACGCGNPDTDADGDGVADCIDPCPADNPDDSDGDGVCDSADACPGADDTLDANGNGTPDCLEAAPPPPQPAPDACGCDGGTGGMMIMPMTLLGMGWLRRRTRRRRR